MVNQNLLSRPFDTLTQGAKDAEKTFLNKADQQRSFFVENLKMRSYF